MSAVNADSANDSTGMANKCFANTLKATRTT